ncbi:hypothetical protein Nepgr_010913 [Nepenthes gracilis]|uniref:Peroxidase n=1 Tax=Nepenthes gracilis TaxID=150966 RepID=A0AAD3XLG5_NEPGR|nr:hypothetical protein Nepgr_010913 [Nepenthes gracilis]
MGLGRHTRMSTLTALLWILMILVLNAFHLKAHLQVGFYDQSCGLAELIVKDEVRKGLMKDVGFAAGLIRMHFHDCFIRGCDGSVLIDSTALNIAEKDSSINNPSLRGFEIIDNAKARIEAICKGVVSCADILALAARDSVQMVGGFCYDVPTGRKDGRVSLAVETFANLPPPTADVNQLTQIFANKGLTQEEMVTLSGAHTIGRSHCTSFNYRLYNFSTENGQDPTLDAAYATQLKQQCPQGSTNASLVVPMDPISPFVLDSGYYMNILFNRGLFSSDQALSKDSTTAIQVNQNARNPCLWRSKFASAMVKLGQVGVLTGNAGEIRANCRVIN